MDKGPEVVLSGTAKRPAWLTGKSKGERGKTRDVGRGLIMQSFGDHDKVSVFIQRAVWQPAVHGQVWGECL